MSQVEMQVSEFSSPVGLVCLGGSYRIGLIWAHYEGMQQQWGVETSRENGGGEDRKEWEREEGGREERGRGALFVPPLLKLFFLCFISSAPHNALRS